MNLLKRRKLTQKQFAQMVEAEWKQISGRPLSRQAVSAWVTGKEVPKLSPAETLVVISVLDCSLTELVSAFADIPKKSSETP